MSKRLTTPDLFAAAATTTTQETGAWIHAHCDGGARGNPGPAGYGAIITAEDGTVLAELSEFLGFKTNNFAEYSGLLGVLQWALDNGHPRVKLVSDSELMVKQIQGKYKVNSPDLRPLYDEAKRRISRLDGFQITHALRHKNKHADRLANEAMDRGMKRGPAEVGAPAPPPLKATPYPSAAPYTPPVIQRREDHARSQEKPLSEPILPGITPEPKPVEGTMLRGFTRDGVIHILGSHSLPDGVFVKIIRE
jgi:ribonuclease HI